MYETLYVISNIARWLNIPKIERREECFVFKLEARFRRYFVYSFVSSPIDIVAIEILAGSSLGSCYLNPCLRIYSISPILKLQNKISHLSFPGSRRVNADPDLERRITTPILNIDLWTSSLDRVSINLYNLERKLSWDSFRGIFNASPWIIREKLPWKLWFQTKLRYLITLKLVIIDDLLRPFNKRGNN